MTPTVKTNTQTEFLQDLISFGHLVPTGEPGLFGRGGMFEEVRNRFDALVTGFGAVDRPETMRFPAVMSRRTLEKAGYLKSFPHLCGSVLSFAGTDSAALDLAERADRHEDWTTHLSTTGVVLAPAGCYPAYPAIALRGSLPPGGVTVDLGGCCVFRNEPSQDPARMQMFHMREVVRIGEVEDVLAWRETWIARAKEIFTRSGLCAAFDVASDPFFGRGGKLLAKSQREQRLKFEALVAIASPEPTAVASFNFHQDHFGSTFQIRLDNGKTATSACVAFGLERIALALFRAHGMDIRDWPIEIRNQFWPEGVATAQGTSHGVCA